jgi:hypothetical protein
MELLASGLNLNDEYQFEIQTDISDILNKEDVAGTRVSLLVPWGLSEELKEGLMIRTIIVDDPQRSMYCLSFKKEMQRRR